MIKSIRLFCLILSLFFVTNTFAYATILTENSFSDVQQMIAMSRHPHHLLVVLDDDDTLTMMPCYPYSVGTLSTSQCQYIGGPAWFAWQAGLKKGDSHRVWNSFSELIQINYLLFDLSKMPLDDPTIPSALNTITQTGAHVIVASARGYGAADATENQLTQDNILSVVENDAIHTPTNHISFPGFYFPIPWGTHTKPRRIAYIHGVLYLSGQNKGVMIKQFLEKTNQTHNITKIIFVDDTNQNVKDVYHAYANDPAVNVLSVHYTRLAKHKADFKTNTASQILATKQWEVIEAALKNNLTGSDF